uniref:Ribosomal protein S14 n=1 Tax=Ditylenchus dipsaci TaxID=166011 RepID=A0A915E0C6_9BILA
MKFMHSQRIGVKKLAVKPAPTAFAESRQSAILGQITTQQSQQKWCSASLLRMLWVLIIACKSEKSVVCRRIGRRASYVQQSTENKQQKYGRRLGLTSQRRNRICSSLHSTNLEVAGSNW